ncbi:MAG: site-2 protease family protein [Clostridia bacterium]|nr:site-2 protease family protein [Clostridia bacterium]
MLFSLLNGGNPKEAIASLLLALPVIFLALSVHEVAHGFVAWKCGDSTAYNLGRLTLNPLKHLDPMGTLCMLLVGYGWAKPVPVNTRNFRNPKRGMALTAAAGPAANLLMGIFGSVLAGVFLALMNYTHLTDSPILWQNVCTWSYILFNLMGYLNFMYMAFNLIPVPPFDGSRIALFFLPEKTYFKVMRYERQIMMGVLLTLLVLSYLLDFSPFAWIAQFLSSLIEFPIANGIFTLLLPSINLG